MLRLVARGLSNKQIAERLVIWRKTAGNHVEHVYAKAGVRNRAQASLFAFGGETCVVIDMAEEDGDYAKRA